MDIPLDPNKDITYFAKTNFRNSEKLFGIKRKDRRQHMYLLGKSGSGKSVLLSNMIIQNIVNGEGVCVVDPHGELVESILESIPPHRVQDVVYFNPADTDFHLGFNVLELEDQKYKHLVASGLMGIFTKIWANAWSARMEYILNNAILALLDTPGSTLLGIPRLLVDKDFRQQIINNLKDPVVKAFWIHEYEAWRDQFRNEAIAPIQNKVGQFLSTSIVRNVVGQAKSTINIFDIMNGGKIFLVNVSKGRIGEDNSALLGGMLITKIQLSAMERVRIPEKDRRDFYLYVDEFQNFVTDSFASILSEARKYRLDLTLAHQYISQLVTKESTSVRDAVFGNVGTMIIFRVGAADAEFLEKEFEPEFTPEDLVNIPNYHIYLKLMVDGVTSRPFSATTLPPFDVATSGDVTSTIIESSRRLYTRPREVVEEEINTWSGMASVGVQGEGKFKALCSSCGKETMVPFEPIPGRPVYCRDCMAKIKSGEMQPVRLMPQGKGNKYEEEPRSVNALAMLGIEFKMSPNAQKSEAPHESKPRDSFPHPKSATPKPFVPGGQNTYRPPKEKEKRKGPDLVGLHAILGEALGDSFMKPKTEPLPETPAVKNEVPEKTISLSDLKKPARPDGDRSGGDAPKTPAPSSLSTKEASAERVSALKNVLAEALNKSAPASVSPAEVKLDTSADDARAREAEEALKKSQAEEKAREEARLKELEEERKKLAILAEEKQAKLRALEQEAKARELAEAKAKKEALFAAEKKEKEQAVREEEARAIAAEEKFKSDREAKAAQEKEDKAAADTASASAPKKPREVPEDILNDILRVD